MPRRPRIDRRAFVRLLSVQGAAFFSTPLLAQAFDDQGLAGEGRRAGLGQDPEKGALTHWGRMRFRSDAGVKDNWNVHPHGDLRLIESVNEHASVNLDPTWNTADVNDLEAMARFPMLFMHAETAPDLTGAEKQNLREYMLRGGFVYAEDCVNGSYAHGHSYGHWDFFFQRVRDVFREILPEARVERLPLDHPIFSCFFRLPGGQPHIQGQEHGGWGVTHRGRLVAYLSPSDSHCGWTSTQWFGRDKSVEALKMGTNVYLYAMTR